MENRPTLPESSHPQTAPMLVETVGAEPHFNLIGAILGGLVGGLIAAVLWGAFVAITNIQFGLVGIIVGFIVGYGVRLGGRGANLGLGVIAALFALGATVLGNIFVIANFVGRTRGNSLLETFSPSELPFVISAFTRSFEFQDLLFYGLAVYIAFSAASRDGVQGIRS
jgi:hypothetical protein